MVALVLSMAEAYPTRTVCNSYKGGRLICDNLRQGTIFDVLEYDALFSAA
jgi:hypothetical protein